VSHEFVVKPLLEGCLKLFLISNSIRLFSIETGGVLLHYRSDSTRRFSTYGFLVPEQLLQGPSAFCVQHPEKLDLLIASLATIR